ncbi:MAG: hypothetical protein C5B59_04005 [Bacteroidetes bacterium]|nr:MAG: hypothetical protein C5B59_04005 [Bacteroidota bacterium]
MVGADPPPCEHALIQITSARRKIDKFFIIDCVQSKIFTKFGFEYLLEGINQKIIFEAAPPTSCLLSVDAAFSEDD